MTGHPTGSGRLALVGPGGRRKQYLLIASLVGIIVAALALAIVYGFGDDEGHKPPGAILFTCLDCGAVFEYDPAGQPGQAPRTVPMKRMGPIRCRVCNAPARALQMTRCPACRKHYLSAASRWQQEKDRLTGQGKDASALGACPPTVCPHCKTDLHAWYRRYDAQRRRR